MTTEFIFDGICIRNKRPTNMDCILMTQREIQGEEIGFFLLCDGVGSTVLGGNVAHFVAQELNLWFSTLEKAPASCEELKVAVLEVNQSLLGWLSTQEETGASTLTALILTQEKGFLVHLGDSRLYESGKNMADPWILRSKDQKNENGALTDYMGHPQPLPFLWETLLKSGQFLLASDGFYNRLDWEKAALQLGQTTKNNMFSTLSALAEENIALGEGDNCSGLLVQIV